MSDKERERKRERQQSSIGDSTLHKAGKKKQANCIKINSPIHSFGECCWMFRLVLTAAHFRTPTSWLQSSWMVAILKTTGPTHN